MKDVFWKDLVAPCGDRFLELSSFGPFQSQTVQDPYCSHGCQSGFCFIQFGNLLSGSCMGAGAFENLVIYLRSSALLKGKLVTAVFLQAYSYRAEVWGKISLSQHSLLKPYQQHRVGTAMPKKRVSSDIFCVMRRYAAGLH